MTEFLTRMDRRILRKAFSYEYFPTKDQKVAESIAAQLGVSLDFVKQRLESMENLGIVDQFSETIERTTALTTIAEETS